MPAVLHCLDDGPPIIYSTTVILSKIIYPSILNPDIKFDILDVSQLTGMY